MHNSNKSKIISWRNCDNHEEHAYLQPIDISKYSLYTLNKYRRVLDIKWQKYRYSLSLGVYESKPYSYISYKEFYPKALYDTIQYFSTLIIPQRKTSQYIDAIKFELQTNWYESLHDRKTAYGILKLMIALKMIYKYDDRKGYHKYYLNPVIYHDLTIRQMELYCKNTARLFGYKYNELPRNKGDCELFITPQIITLNPKLEDHGDTA